MSPIKRLEGGKGEVLAIIIGKDFSEGLNFISEPHYSLQAGFHKRIKGDAVKPHYHARIAGINESEVQEFFHVIEGEVVVDIFDRKMKKRFTEKIGSGESILLMAGHSLSFTENTKMIEIKNGPYRGKEIDKVYIEKRRQNQSGK